MSPTEHGRHFWHTILIGFITVAPLWVTWLVFDFLLGILAGAGTPLLRGAVIRSLFLRTLLFADLWWILAEGRLDSWLLGGVAVMTVTWMSSSFCRRSSSPSAWKA